MIDTPSEDSVFTQIDEDRIANKAAEIAKQGAIEAAKNSLIQTLQGDKPRFSWEEKGKQAPSDYAELMDEVKRQVPSLSQDDIDRRVEEKLKAREEQARLAEEESLKKKHESIEDSRKKFDSEWYQLVQEGKMPKVAEDIQERINKGDRLTKDEIMADEGLKARLELAQLSQNKSAKLAYYEDYSQEHAGKNAPVLGGRPGATNQVSEEYTYEDITKDRKKFFGF